MEFGDFSVYGTSNSNRRLIGHDVDHILVFDNRVAHSDVPSGNFTLDNTFSDVW